MSETEKKMFDKKDTLLMKGIAIMLLLFYHLFESADLLEGLQVNHKPFSQETFLMLSGYGRICVAMFVFLSAYGITRGLTSQPDLLKEDWRELYRQAGKRCLKLIGNFAVLYLSVNLLWFSYFDYAKLYGKGWQGCFLALVDMLGLAQIMDTPTLSMTWWYMKVAIFIIFAVPLLYLLVRKFGNYLVFIGLLLTCAVKLDADIQPYLFVAVCGVTAAYGNWFEKIQMSDRMNSSLWKWLKIPVGALLIGFTVVFRQNYIIHSSFLWLVDAPIVFLLCLYGVEVIGKIPLLSTALKFIGKHSMNIFLVHTFFYMAIYQPYIYKFRYAAVTYLLLLAVTLVYSVLLDLMKRGGTLLITKVTERAIHR